MTGSACAASRSHCFAGNSVGKTTAWQLHQWLPWWSLAMEDIQTGSQRLQVAKQPCKEQHHARCQRGSDQSLEPDRKQGGSQLQLQAWPPTTWGRVILLYPVFARSFFKPAVLRKQGRVNQDTIFSQTPHTRLIRGDAELRKVT